MTAETPWCIDGDRGACVLGVSGYQAVCATCGWRSDLTADETTAYAQCEVHVAETGHVYQETPYDTRRAIVRGETVDRVRAYLPANYTASATDDGVLIVGRDDHGWTLDGYVIPRLASGLMFATEVTT